MLDVKDELWSMSVRLREFDRCEVCGRKGTEAHHNKGRRNKASAYDVDNGIALCFWCHRGSNTLAAHSTNSEAVKAFEAWLSKSKHANYKPKINYGTIYKYLLDEIKDNLIIDLSKKLHCPPNITAIRQNFKEKFK